MNQVGEIFIFIGPPGAGKGSLANLCVKHFNWLQISTGNLCRKHIAEQTKIGKEIDLIIKSGKLINDELITRMVFEWLDKNTFNAMGIIFDGYPRTVAQAKELDVMLRLNFPLVKVKVVWFTLKEDVVIERLCSRYVCENKDCQAVYSSGKHSEKLMPLQLNTCDICFASLGRRADDEEEAVRKRLDIYYKHESELINFYYDNKSSIIKLDASKPLHQVFECFRQRISE